MQCPNCKAEAGASEFCPSCLAQIGQATRKPVEEVEAQVAEKDAAEARRKQQEFIEQGRKSIIYGGLVLVAVSVGVALAAIVGVLSESPQPQQMETLPQAGRVRCGRDKDCGTDSCGRAMRCQEKACVRIDSSPCKEGEGAMQDLPRRPGQ